MLKRHSTLSTKVDHLEKSLTSLDEIDVASKLDRMASCLLNLEAQQDVIKKVGQRVSALERVDLGSLTNEVEKEINTLKPRVDSLEQTMKECGQKLQALDTKMMKEMLGTIET